MKRQIIALISGILFGLGLGLSQMVDRDRVLAFLDVTGTWDPTLLFVLGGAVGVTLLTFRFVLRRSSPLFTPKFYLPSRRDIDRRLIVGAAIFGIGWGIAGYCPGPGLTALVLGIWNPVLFLISLIAGSLLYQRFKSRNALPETAPGHTP
ncbi:hypothetical protein C1752_07865 [Acaryochloris thomasi RCC1774]|uniref:YeeE/YedE family protein n=1 Tax=Acaryochloris thomasi RCC1774 TaxID=1764569 RepID=A0A2W1JQE2_9CYAN|nr:DUF6691 family protein [Acaryochloris thomasi]PZD71137.1 hypothetical protein C1752_07865 [Acaryochloris thomasi RCC1774]